MPDIPPANRAERRGRGRPKGSKTVFLHQAAKAGAPSVKAQQASLNQTSHPSPDTSTLDGYGVTAEELPDYTEQGGEPVFTGYRGKYGLLKTNIVTTYATMGMFLGGPGSPDGILFLTYSEKIADAWIAWGKSDPRYMKIVMVLWGGPFMTLMLAHSPLIAGVLANHDVPMAKFLNPLSQLGRMRGTILDLRGTVSDADLAHAEEPGLGAYVPAGPMAPTDDQGPPPAPQEGLRIYPDEGLPAEVDVQLRQIARQMNKSYEELRDQYLLELAQERLAHNQHVNAPATLGMPVTKPGV